MNLRVSLILTTIFILFIRLSRQIPGYVPCNWPLLAPWWSLSHIIWHSSTIETAPFNNTYLQPHVVKFNTVVVMYLLHVLANLLFWHLFLSVFTMPVDDWGHRAWYWGKELWKYGSLFPVIWHPEDVERNDCKGYFFYASTSICLFFTNKREE